MSTETLLSTLLTTSITGAGLILAIYTLITPMSRRLFENRVELLRKKMKQFDKMKEKISPESSAKEIKNLQNLAKEIKETRMFPRYLGLGVAIVFVSYMITVITALGMLVNPEPNDVRLPIVMVSFISATSGFLVVGLHTILDVHRTMKEEFEEVKKKQKEIEEKQKKLREAIQKGDIILRVKEVGKTKN